MHHVFVINNSLYWVLHQLLLIACFPWANSAFIQGGNGKYGKYCAIPHETLTLGYNMNDPKQRSWFFVISEPHSPLLISLTNNLYEGMDHKPEYVLVEKTWRILLKSLPVSTMIYSWTEGTVPISASPSRTRITQILRWNQLILKIANPKIQCNIYISRITCYLTNLNQQAKR